jgi:hypothetical protein
MDFQCLRKIDPSMDSWAGTGRIRRFLLWGAYFFLLHLCIFIDYFHKLRQNQADQGVLYFLSNHYLDDSLVQKRVLQ